MRLLIACTRCNGTQAEFALVVNSQGITATLKLACVAGWQQALPAFRLLLPPEPEVRSWAFPGGLAGLFADGDNVAWTKTTRGRYRRAGLRYASDTTYKEWMLLSRLSPKRGRVGRPREMKLRAVMDSILYILATGIQWRALPKDFPPFTTIQYYFYA
jgi:Putative transposase of IS4/5 family (DUF4096)